MASSTSAVSPITEGTSPQGHSKRSKLLKRPQVTASLSTPRRARTSYFGGDIIKDSDIATAATKKGGNSKDLKRTASLVDKQPETPANNGIANQPDSHNGASKTSRDDHPVGKGKFRISTDIPRGSSLLGVESMDQLSFSKRGSILLGGKKALANSGGSGEAKASQDIPEGSSPKPKIKFQLPVLSADDELLSQRVRSMYEYGDPDGPEYKSGRLSRIGDYASVSEEAVSENEDDHGTPNDAMRHLQGTSRRYSSLPGSRSISRSQTRRESMIIREETELAGGIEDWDDVTGPEVDRYGFIVSQKSGLGAVDENADNMAPHRVSAVLQIRSSKSRPSQSSPSSRHASRSNTPQPRKLNKKSSNRSLNPPSLFSNPSTPTSTTNPIRRITSLRRRRPDHAADMLTLSPNLPDISESAASPSFDRERETSRASKWQKMARARPSPSGGGTDFTFDAHDPKLISRTWKGIPDRWRACAWYSFLRASAARYPSLPSEELLIATFYELCEASSPDDVQIDIDVPRTINAHIMFRRRYRGGQRLLFRLLHAMSLYFPDTAYVQGMASLAATLLCYFPEEQAFVMMVRLWVCRGLKKLYEPGFGGLTVALEELESGWLGGKDIGAKLKRLDIPPTSYGTRWYLTLFNYSIPFPAQLRVWDVFMLLDPAVSPGSSGKNLPKSTSAQTKGQQGEVESFNHTLDVLHAVSSALLAGMREVLLEADFEEAMKVLTSFVPVKDEEILMQVTHGSWKAKSGKR